MLGNMKDIPIPNWLIFGMALAFALAAVLLPLPKGAVGEHVLLAAGMLVVGVVMFTQGHLGGGVAKFVAVAALWLGPTKAFFLGFLCVGMVLGAVFVVVMRLLGRRLTSVPYAPIIMPLFLFVLSQEPMWRQALAGFRHPVS